MQIARVFNNNAVLVNDEGTEAVVMGRGVGFSRHPGDTVDIARVERRFIPSDGTHGRGWMDAFFTSVPADDLLLIDEIVALASLELGVDDPAQLFLPLADHLVFAMRRADAGDSFSYPLAAEVSLLYPKEVAVARRILALLADRRGTALPEVEAIPLSLHFVNAGFGRDADPSRVVVMTETIAKTLALVGERYNITLDENSVDVARFVTHLRHMFVRQASMRPSSGLQDELLRTLSVEAPRAVATARDLHTSLRSSFGWHVSNEEIFYLSLHVARLTREGIEYVEDS